MPENLRQVDRLVVVTHPDDWKTKLLCEKHGVDVYPTTVFHESGDKFNKGRALNLGLSHLRHDGWLLILDADIVLPHNFRSMLRQSSLNEKRIYGADRLNTHSYENWIKHKNDSIPQHQWRYLVRPNPHFSLGSRLLHQEYGYCPIGYFQLWHSSMKRKYSVISGSAEHDDVLFAVQWARDERILLPEFFVYHLESEQAPMGANWKGRKTKPFGPCKPEPCPPKPYCSPENLEGRLR